MKTIEQLLATGDAFGVDSTACMQHADILKSYSRQIETEVWSAEPRPVQLIFKVAFISICHQFNWDFLQRTLADRLLNTSEDILSIISGVTAPKISRWLSEYPRQERVRAKERARLLRDVSKTLQGSYQGDIQAFYKDCSKARLGRGEFHELMDQFESYRSDRLRKKTNILSHDLVRERIIEFTDPQNLEPAIDYHIMRLYLRTGRVVPSSTVLFRYLEGAPNPRGSLVRELRRITAEAAKLTSYYSGLSVADVNFIEWQIGRSICLNDAPLCDSLGDSEGLSIDVKDLTNDACPFRKVCLSRNHLPAFMAFEEPDYVSSDY